MFTGLLIAILIVAGAATVIAGGVVLAQRKRQLPGGSNPLALPSGSDDQLLERTIRDLRPGDVLTYEGKDFLVEGVISYDEDGHRWSAGRIVDGNDTRWMVVGMERGGAFIVRVAQVIDFEIEGYPPETLHVGDDRFVQDKKGTATARMAGDTGMGGNNAGGMDTVMRCRWWLYDRPGDDTLVVEQWSDEFRVLRGKKVNPALIDLMPGS